MAGQRGSLALSLLLLGALCSAAGRPQPAAALADSEPILYTTPTGPAVLPTAAQLQWQASDFMALIHFNMATFFRNGDPGCNASNWPQSQRPASFAPSALNVSQWVASMRDLGATEAVLTAKHGCGFLLWPTATTLPSGDPYGYNVPAATNVLKLFADTMQAAGIGHGFYYSLTNNFYLNVKGHYAQNGTLLPGQQRVTQAEFEALATAQLTELWTQFGNLTEIWFDGGYTTDMGASLKALLAAHQPTAVGTNGGGISANPVRWSGTEGDVPPCGYGARKGQGACPDVWSSACCTTCYGAGCRPETNSSAFWYPSFTDYTLQAGDTWFWEPGVGLRPLDELIFAYHSTVGHNTKLELDFAIDRSGRVAPAHAARYAELGGWVKSCYATPLATGSLVGDGARQLVVASPGGGLGTGLFDRVMMREPLAMGERVRGYLVEAYDGGRWVPFSSGRAIGNKRIDLSAGQRLFNASAVRLTITADVGAPHVDLMVFAPCATGGLPGVTRLGTADIGMTETTPLVFNGTLYRFESVRGGYWNNTLGHGATIGPVSYLRLRRLVRTGAGYDNGEIATGPFGVGYGLACALADAEDTQRVFAYGSQESQHVGVWSSLDLEHWDNGTALETPPSWTVFNTAVARGVLGGKPAYAMALEVRAPLFPSFGLVFATAPSASGPWQLGVSGSTVELGFGPGSCPALRFDAASGYWYMLYTPNPTVAGGGYRTWQVYATRSRTLRPGSWEASPRSPLLVADARDRIVASPGIPEAQRGWAKNTTNLNSSDPDLVEVDGQVLLVFNWGDQRSTPTDNLAQAVFNGTMVELWQALFAPQD